MLRETLSLTTRKQRSRGLTLPEMMIVIAIVTVFALAAIFFDANSLMVQ